MGAQGVSSAGLESRSLLQEPSRIPSRSPSAQSNSSDGIFPREKPASGNPFALQTNCSLNLFSLKQKLLCTLKTQCIAASSEGHQQNELMLGVAWGCLATPRTYQGCFLPLQAKSKVLSINSQLPPKLLRDLPASYCSCFHLLHMMWRKPATVVCLSHFSWSGRRKKKKIKRERESRGRREDEGSLMQSRSIRILSAYL